MFMTLFPMKKFGLTNKIYMTIKINTSIHHFSCENENCGTRSAIIFEIKYKSLDDWAKVFNRVKGMRCQRCVKPLKEGFFTCKSKMYNLN